MINGRKNMCLERSALNYTRLRTSWASFQISVVILLSTIMGQLLLRLFLCYHSWLNQTLLFPRSKIICAITSWTWLLILFHLELWMKLIQLLSIIPFTTWNAKLLKLNKRMPIPKFTFITDFLKVLSNLKKSEIQVPLT